MVINLCSGVGVVESERRSVLPFSEHLRLKPDQLSYSNLLGLRIVSIVSIKYRGLFFFMSAFNRDLLQIKLFFFFLWLTSFNPTVHFGAFYLYLFVPVSLPSSVTESFEHFINGELIFPQDPWLSPNSRLHTVCQPKPQRPV